MKDTNTKHRFKRNEKEKINNIYEIKLIHTKAYGICALITRKGKTLHEPRTSLNRTSLIQKRDKHNVNNYENPYVSIG